MTRAGFLTKTRFYTKDKDKESSSAIEALIDQDRIPNSKKENNAKSSSAIEALSDEDRVLDYGGLGNFSLSGFEMVSVATNEDEDDRPI